MVDHETRLNAVFAALADPTRRRLLEILKQGESRVTDLAKPFAMSLPAVSKHLKILEQAGLLGRTRQGRVHHMQARPETMQEARAWMGQYVQFWQDSFDRLDRFLAEKPDDPKEPIDEH